MKNTDSLRLDWLIARASYIRLPRRKSFCETGWRGGKSRQSIDTAMRAERAAEKKGRGRQ